MPKVKTNRYEINKAIIDLIFLHGYDACSMQMISNRVGVTKACLYHYGDKESLVLKAIKEFLGDDFKLFYCALHVYMSCNNHKNHELLKEAKKLINQNKNLRVFDIIEKYFDTVEEMSSF